VGRDNAKVKKKKNARCKVLGKNKNEKMKDIKE